MGSPFLAIAADEAGVAEARQALKQQVSFYASTRSYHAVLRHHGWEDLGANYMRFPFRVNGQKCRNRSRMPCWMRGDCQYL